MFRFLYSVLTNTMAEGHALLDGLHMTHQLGIKNVLVESNSTVAVNWIKSGVCNFWYM